MQLVILGRVTRLDRVMFLLHDILDVNGSVYRGLVGSEIFFSLTCFPSLLRLVSYEFRVKTPLPDLHMAYAKPPLQSFLSGN